MLEVKTETIFPCWAILELMGHRRMAGWLSEVSLGGMSMIRIDVPGEGEAWTATQLYAPAALYCITPTTQEIARALAKSCQPEPVHAYEIRAFLPPSARREEEEESCLNSSPGEPVIVHAWSPSDSAMTACGLPLAAGSLTMSDLNDKITCPTCAVGHVWHALAATTSSMTACGLTISHAPLRIADVESRVTCGDCLTDDPF